MPKEQKQAFTNEDNDWVDEDGLLTPNKEVRIKKWEGPFDKTQLLIPHASAASKHKEPGGHAGRHYGFE